MFCEKCGANLEENSTFCTRCGARVVEDISTAPEARAVPTGTDSSYNDLNNQRSASTNNYSQYNGQPNNTYNNAYGNYPQQNTEPMTVGQYIVTFLLMAIPFVGIVLMFVWAFSSGENINRRNLCRAQLILAGIVLGIYILLLILMVAVFGGIGASVRGGYYY